MHRGKIVDETVRRLFPNLTKLAGKLPWGVRTIYRHFEDEELSYEHILEYSKALNYDFKEEFPELDLFKMTVSEPIAAYKTMSNDELRMELERYRDKYERLLEKYNNILEKYLELKDTAIHH